MIDRSNSQLSVKGLPKKIEEKTISPDLAIQRNFVWDEERQSLLVHSILCGYPIPQIYAQDKGDSVLHLLDGKQRIGTMYRFVTDQFALTKDTPPVVDYDKDGNVVATTEIAGMKFSELPEEFQDRIRNFDFNVVRLRNMSITVRDDFFQRINNGMPLTKIELTRVRGGSTVMEFVNMLAERPFFAKVSALTTNMRRRFVDTEVVLQTMILVANGGEPTELDGRAVAEFVNNLKKNGIPEDLKKTMLDTLDYLESVFTVREPDMKKVHVPTLFLYAVNALKNTDNPIPANRFGGWVQRFFADLKNKDARSSAINIYKPAVGSSSARKEQVRARINGMGMHFANQIWDAPDYKAPQIHETDPTQPKRGRGRPVTDPKKLAAIAEQERLAREQQEKDGQIQTEQQMTA